MEETSLMPTLAEASLPPGTQQLPPELREDESPLRTIQRKDAARESFPGEHWLVLALGVAVWQFTRRDRRWYVRGLGGLAATTLVARAAAGREGLSRVLRYTPLGNGINRCPPCETPGKARVSSRA